MANTFNKKSDKVIDHLYAAEIIFNYCKERGILEKHLTVFAEIFRELFEKNKILFHFEIEIQ